MRVVNVRHAVPGSFVYIGRKNGSFAASEWRNTFLEGKDGTRLEVIAKYKQLLWKRMRESKEICERLLLLDGRDLGCWCAPLPCHGDVLIAAISYLKGLDK